MHEIGSGRARRERAASRRNPDLDLSQVVTVEPRAVSGAAKITAQHALDYVEGGLHEND
jgi:hypothetical protein